MGEKKLDDIVESLKELTGDSRALIIYLPTGESKTNQYKDAYVCPQCGQDAKKSPSPYTSVCTKCGTWNYNWDMVTTVC